MSKNILTVLGGPEIICVFGVLSDSNTHLEIFIVWLLKKTFFLAELDKGESCV